MSKYVLKYFDLRARGEIVRFIFAAAGQDFEDKRVSFEEWNTIKEDMPFGQLPILEVDGVVIAQMCAIARYLARMFGFAGETPIEDAQVDMIVYTLDEMITYLSVDYKEPDEQRKKARKTELAEVVYPERLSQLEKLLVSNGDGNGFFVGTKMTWADMLLAIVLEFPGGLNINLDLKPFPKLLALKHRVDTTPNIAKWIAKRPPTTYF